MKNIQFLMFFKYFKNIMKFFSFLVKKTMFLVKNCRFFLIYLSFETKSEENVMFLNLKEKKNKN